MTIAPKAPTFPQTWPRLPKYRPGKQLTRVQEVVRAMADRRWLYLNGVVKHPAIIYNMSLATVVGFLRRGGIRIAIVNSAPR